MRRVPLGNSIILVSALTLAFTACGGDTVGSNAGTTTGGDTASNGGGGDNDGSTGGDDIGGGNGDSMTPPGGDSATGPSGDTDTTPTGQPRVTIMTPNDGEYFLWVGAGTAPTIDLLGEITDDTNILAQNVSWTVTAPDTSTTSNQGNIMGAGTTLRTGYAYTLTGVGDYLVELNYSDGTMSGTASITIHAVDNLPPNIVIEAPADTNQDGTADMTPLEGALIGLIGVVGEPDADAVIQANILWTVTDPSGGTSSGAGTIVCNGAGDSCDSTFSYTLGAPGTYTIELGYTDAGSNVFSSSVQLEAVANTPPTCQIMGPTDGFSVPDGGQIFLQGAAADINEPSGNLTVEWFIDDVTGTAISSQARDNPNVTFTTPAPCEAHTLYCVVTDSQGATGQASIGFIVNTAPTLMITAVEDQDTNSVRSDFVFMGGGPAFADPATVTAITTQLTVVDDEDSFTPGADVTIEIVDSLSGAAIGSATFNPFVDGVTLASTWGPTDFAPEIGKHTLVVKVTDSCGAVDIASADVVFAPQMETVTQLNGSNNWDVDWITAVGDSLYVAYDDGNNDQLVFLPGIDPAATTAPTITDYSDLLDAGNLGGTRVRVARYANDTMYFATSGGIFSCPVTDASTGDYSLAIADTTNPTECTFATAYEDSSAQQIASSTTRALLILPSGAIVAGTDNGGVYIPAPGTNLGQGVECTSGERVLDMAYDPVSNAIFGGTDGAFAFKWQGPTFEACEVSWLNDSNAPMRGGDDIIDAVAVDSTGVWFGTDQPTLLHLETGSDIWLAHGTNATPLNPNRSIDDLAVEVQQLGAPASDRDILWIVQSPPPNVWRTARTVHRHDGIIPSWTTFSDDLDGIPDNRVRMMTVDSNGVKWLATPTGIGVYTAK